MHKICKNHHVQNTNHLFRLFIWWICRFNMFYIFYFKKTEWRDQRSSKKDLAWRLKMVFTIFLKSYQKVTNSSWVPNHLSDQNIEISESGPKYERWSSIHEKSHNKRKKDDKSIKAYYLLSDQKIEISESGPKYERWSSIHEKSHNKRKKDDKSIKAYYLLSNHAGTYWTISFIAINDIWPNSQDEKKMEATNMNPILHYKIVLTGGYTQ